MAQMGKSGYLTKLGEKHVLGRPSWKARYFVISGANLSYYKDDKTAKAQGTIDLNEIEIKDVTKEHGELAFGLKPAASDRVYVILAKTHSSKDDWVNAIKLRRTSLKQDRGRNSDASVASRKSAPTTTPLASSPPSTSSSTGSGRGNTPTSPTNSIERGSFERDANRKSKEEESLASLIPDGATEHELRRAAGTVRVAMQSAITASGMPVLQTHLYHLKPYPESFLGSDAVTWACESKLASSRSQVTGIFESFFRAGVLLHVTNEQSFKDEGFLYKWKNPSDPSDPVSKDVPVTIHARERAASTMKPKESVIKEGFLTKLGDRPNVLQQLTWKSRFFVLTASKLLYYKDASKFGEGFGSIELCASEMPVVGSEHGPLSFGLKPAGNPRTYILQAKTLETRNEWMKAIVAARAKALSLRDSKNEKFPCDGGTLAVTLSETKDAIDLLRAAQRIRVAMYKGVNEIGQPLIDTHKGVGDSFIGSEAVWWVVNVDIAFNRDVAVSALDKLLSFGSFRHVTKEHGFEDNPQLLYRWEDVSELLRGLELTTGKTEAPPVAERSVSDLLAETRTTRSVTRVLPPEPVESKVPKSQSFTKKPIATTHTKDLSGMGSSSLSKKDKQNKSLPSRSIPEPRSPVDVFINGEDEPTYLSLDFEESKIRRVLCCCLPSKRSHLYD